MVKRILKRLITIQPKSRVDGAIIGEDDGTLKFRCNMRRCRPTACVMSARRFSGPWARRRISGPDCLSASQFPGRPERALGVFKGIACGAGCPPETPACQSRKLNCMLIRNLGDGPHGTDTLPIVIRIGGHAIFGFGDPHKFFS